MRTPTAHHIEGFFHGMAHAAKVAEASKRGAESAQLNAIRRESATLALIAARPKAEARRPVDWQQNSPETPKRPRVVSVLCAVGELLSVMFLLSAIYWVPWVYYALTGVPLDFGGGQ